MGRLAWSISFHVTSQVRSRHTSTPLNLSTAFGLKTQKQRSAHWALMTTDLPPSPSITATTKFPCLLSSLMPPTPQSWFESFVLANILLIGIATGLELENNGADASVSLAVDVISGLTLAVFTLECVLKIMAEGDLPSLYFTDPDVGKIVSENLRSSSFLGPSNVFFFKWETHQFWHLSLSLPPIAPHVSLFFGPFGRLSVSPATCVLQNTFDFAIVILSLSLIGSGSATAVGALRILRLARLLTFIKGVRQLRVIIAGLVQVQKRTRVAPSLGPLHPTRGRPVGNLFH